jgi:hypothetical protein
LVLVDLFPYPRVVVPVRDIVVVVLSPFHYFAEYPKATTDVQDAEKLAYSSLLRGMEL